MFEVGFTEIIFIVGLALIILGPEKLPGLVNKVGRWTGRARSMARQLRMQLEQEVTLDELSKSRTMQGGPPPSTGNDAYPEPPPESTACESSVPIDDAPSAAAAPISDEANDTRVPEPVDLSKPQQ